MGCQSHGESGGTAMNPHLPFIIGSYSIFAVVLIYCALVPVVRGRKIRAQVNRYHRSRIQNETQT